MAVAKLTKKLQDELVGYLKRGHYKHAACALVGIHRDTLNYWEQRGRKARARRDEGLPVPRTELPYLHLLDQVEFALDYGEGWLMEQALDAIENPKDRRWQGYVTILERSRPDRWRRRSAAEYVDPDGGKRKPGGRTIDVAKLNAEERAAFRELLEKATRDGA